MATLFSIHDEIELEMRLLGAALDPFQMDLEWFEYELAIKVSHKPDVSSGAPPPGGPIHERRAIRGKINRKDFGDLLAALDQLLGEGHDLRFEPYDLNFYLEWSRETEHLCLIVTWFDLGLSPRNLEQRFPTAHTGVRFIVEDGAVEDFRRDLEREFTGHSGFPDAQPEPLIH
ncbi:MAG TPA: hypothetical protein VJX67_13605 [Blastocatellia bacterium]|nr:hypothetical protein [Blastocatellia bacterium]